MLAYPLSVSRLCSMFLYDAGNYCFLLIANSVLTLGVSKLSLVWWVCIELALCFLTLCSSFFQGPAGILGKVDRKFVCYCIRGFLVRHYLGISLLFFLIIFFYFLKMSQRYENLGLRSKTVKTQIKCERTTYKDILELGKH